MQKLTIINPDSLIFNKPVKLKKKKILIVDEEEEPPILTKEELLKNMIVDDLEKKEELIKEELTQEKKEIPIYVIYEYATKRSLKPITTMAYIYERDTRWALKPKGSTILKICYELVDIKSALFFQAIKNSYQYITEKISEKLFMENVISQNLYAEVSIW